MLAILHTLAAGLGHLITGGVFITLMVLILPALAMARGMEKGARK